MPDHQYTGYNPANLSKAKHLRREMTKQKNTYGTISSKPIRSIFTDKGRSIDILSIFIAQRQES